ncbi:MAG: flagellar hook basal-body protein [Thermoguttaceae bacterium]|jgi:flagellar basal-body rod protein FlgF
MDALTTAAASGMRARMESLDLLANNLANASATGFKADRESYSTWASADALAAQDASGTPAVESPLVERQWTDFSQGVVVPTGNPMDLALDGSGFFVAQSSSGEKYTRSGSFHLDPQGVLSTQEGDPVEGADGKPIRLDPAQPVEVSSAGEIRQSGAVTAQLKLVQFTAPQALGKQGDNSFELAVSDLEPVPATGRVRQGSVEAANVQPAETAVRLVSVMRQFEMLQKAMTLGNQMNQQAIQEVAKASG